MKTVFFDSVGGAAGDMMLAAFAGLGADLSVIENKIRAAMPEEDFRIETEQVSSHGVSGLRVHVKILHDSADERGLHEIEPIIQRCETSNRARELAVKVFHGIAEAEGKVHGKSAHHVHFHEVGAVDSIVDILGSCMAFDMIGADAVCFGPLPEGTGTFTCRHGTYPLPAPATLELLSGHEIVRTDEPFEMITPTGAALLTLLPQGKSRGRILRSSAAFGMRTLRNRPNLLRATLLDSQDTSVEKVPVLLETNVDDATPEILASVMEQMFAKGALDCWITPIIMKHGRPASMISVLCESGREKELTELLFRGTGTLGIRRREVQRTILERQTAVRDTDFGKITYKQGFLDGKLLTEKPEYADCLRAAEARGLTVREVCRALEK